MAKLKTRGDAITDFKLNKHRCEAQEFKTLSQDASEMAKSLKLLKQFTDSNFFFEIADYYKKESERANESAAKEIFKLKNQQHQQNLIDLHGLLPSEAIAFLSQRIETIKGVQELIVITGKGLHSKNGIAKVKPAVERFAIARNIRSQVDKSNPGRIRFYLS